MKIIQTLVACGVVAASTPAAAQNHGWMRDLERQIARAEEIARGVAIELDRARERLAAAQRARRADRTGSDVTEEFTRTVRLGRDGTFDLSNVSGDIAITGASGEDVRITAIKRVRHRNEEEARRILRDIEIRVVERGRNVEVRTQYPGNRRDWNGSVDYTVSVPSGAHIAIRSVSGSISVRGVQGEVRAETVSGAITAADVRRIRRVGSVSGDIQIVDADGDTFAASTVSGGATARNVRAQSIDFRTVGGDLRFENVEAIRATLQSVSGHLTYSGRLARMGRYELRSHSGNIHVVPASGSAFELEANTFSGSIHSEFPLTLTTMGRGTRRSLAGAIRGTSGDGGPVLALHTFSGDITISRR